MYKYYIFNKTERQEGREREQRKAEERKGDGGEISK